MRALLLALPILLWGCPNKDDTAETGDSGETGETGETGDTSDTGIDTASCQDMDGDLDDPQAPGCMSAGGVCIADADGCGSGTRLSTYDSECAFDDGPGYCCAPPSPTASGGTCAESGGVCAPIAGCGMTHGWYTPADAECTAAYGVGSVCCAPATACEGWGVTTCCTTDGYTAFTPSCDLGQEVCTIDGTTLTCDQDCPAFSM